MKDLDQELTVQTAHALVSWIALWGKYITGKTKSVRICHSDDSALLDAADLLVQHGVFGEPNRCDFILISSTPQLAKSYKLEDIIYIFYCLGCFYGYGVRFREQGFCVEEAVSQLFENLTALGFCKKDESYYYWADKTFAINKDGWDIIVPYLEDYRREKKDMIFSNKKAARLIGKFGFRANVWANDELLEQAIYQRIEQNVPKMWPVAIKIL